MSVGVLLITHENVGSSLLESLKLIWKNSLPLPIKVLPIRHENDPVEFRYHAKTICKSLNHGQGVLVLTDLFAATPCRIASDLITNCRVRVVAGVNLPMLFKIMNYYDNDLDTLANKAVSGGCQGVLDVNSAIQ